MFTIMFHVVMFTRDVYTTSKNMFIVLHGAKLWQDWQSIHTIFLKLETPIKALHEKFF